MGIKILKHAYENTKTNSLAFTKLLISWLRANGIRHRLYFQTNWGPEYGRASINVWQKLQKDVFELIFTTMLENQKISAGLISLC